MRSGRQVDQAIATFCIFEIESAYVQFLARWDANELVCEAASAKSVPEIAVILGTEGDAALKKLGFKAPEVSPNYSQLIPIASVADLAYAARLLYRALKHVYHVANITDVKHRIDLPPPPSKEDIVPIRRRSGGPETKTREAWVLKYYDQAGKRRRKTFKDRRDAEQFAEAMRVLKEGSAFLDDVELDYTISRRRLSDLPEPLTVRSIISQIGTVWRANTRLSNAEQAFLTEFAVATDRGSFIDDSFLSAAIEEGKRLANDTYRLGREIGGGVSLHRFFGMYVVNFYQYGEGQDEFGPFAEKDADDAFGKIAMLCLPW